MKFRFRDARSGSVLVVVDMFVVARCSQHDVLSGVIAVFVVWWNCGCIENGMRIAEPVYYPASVWWLWSWWWSHGFDSAWRLQVSRMVDTQLSSYSCGLAVSTIDFEFRQHHLA